MIEKEEPTEEAKQRAKNYMSLKGALEPKQETLEEAAERYTEEHKWEEQDPWLDFIEGAKWQEERMYSEEDMKSAFKVGFSIGYGSDVHAIDEKNRTCEEWFEQFKKK